MRELSLIIAVTAIIITTIITAAYTASNYGQMVVKKQEYEVALEMVRECGDRLWIVWFEEQPLKGRRIQCLERKGKR